MFKINCEKGCQTPAHGRFEYVPIQSMEKNVEILLNLIDIYAKCDC